MYITSISVQPFYRLPLSSSTWGPILSSVRARRVTPSMRTIPPVGPKCLSSIQYRHPCRFPQPFGISLGVLHWPNRTIVGSIPREYPHPSCRSCQRRVIRPPHPPPEIRHGPWQCSKRPTHSSRHCCNDARHWQRQREIASVRRPLLLCKTTILWRQCKCRPWPRRANRVESRRLWPRRIWRGIAITVDWP